MRLHGGLVVMLAIALPAPAAAQTVTMSDLVGTWVQTGGNLGMMRMRMGGARRNNAARQGAAVTPACDSAACKRTLTLRADSTFSMATTVNGQAQGQGLEGRWSLAGDSLMGVFRRPVKVTLQDQELKMWRRRRNGSSVAGPAFKRSDATP
jgi:hypothetical protein